MNCPDCKGIGCFECGKCDCWPWISVKDKMPPLIPGDLPNYSQSDDILAFDGKKICIVNLCQIADLLIFYNSADDSSCEITHWMNLPKPPEGK